MRLSEALLQTVNSANLTYSNHNSDNSFLRGNLTAMEKILFENGYDAVGISKNVPFSHYKEQQLAFVYEENGEKYWIHIPVIMWLHLVWDHHLPNYPLPGN